MEQFNHHLGKPAGSFGGHRFNLAFTSIARRYLRQHLFSRANATAVFGIWIVLVANMNRIHGWMGNAMAEGIKKSAQPGMAPVGISNLAG